MSNNRPKLVPRRHFCSRFCFKKCVENYSSESLEQHYKGLQTVIADFNQHLKPKLSPSSETITAQMQDPKLRFELPQSIRAWQQQSEVRCDSIYTDYEHLAKIMSTHEEVIVRRWQKKTVQQRLTLMQAAWPGSTLPPQRRDWNVWIKMYDSALHSYFTRGKLDAQAVIQDLGFSDINTYLHPFINAADLSDRHALPMFLASRAGNHPFAFICADWHAMSVGRALGVLEAENDVLLPYLVQFRQATDWRMYTSIELESEPIMDSTVHGMTLLPTTALFLLESQKRIMSFLSSCVRLVLHDMATLATIAPTNGTQNRRQDDSDSKRILRWESPYTWRSGIGCHAIDEVILARKTYYIDLLRNLREDPSLYADHMASLNEGIDAGQLPVKIQTETIVFELTTLMDLGELWLKLSERYLRHNQQAVLRADRASSTDRLLDRDKVALETLRYDLLHILVGLWTLLGQHVGACGTQHCQWPFYRRQHPEIQQTEIIQMIDIEDDLHHMVVKLRSAWQLSDQSWINAGSEVRKYLETGAGKDIRGKRIMLQLAVEISEVCACLRQIDMKATESRAWPECLPTDEEIADRDPDKVTGLTNPAHLKAFGKALERAGGPELQKYYYPTHKRKSAGTVKAMQRAEHNLTTLWDNIIQFLEQSGYYEGYSRVVTLLTDEDGVCSTPDYVAEVKISAPIAPPHAALADMYLDLQSRTEKTLANPALETPSSGQKIKKRLKSNVDDLKSHEDGLAADRNAEVRALCPVYGELAEPGPKHIVVDRSALGVFKTLFSNSGEERDPGEVPWGKFLHAMTSAGFAAQKLQGSAWHFSPMSGDLGRSIHIHEPHPVKKLRFCVAKGVGRRLNRAYGWTADTFVLGLKDITN